MADLKQQLDALRRQIESLPSSASANQIAQLESEARALLAQSKNTPQEEAARSLFAELARHSAPASPEAAAVRNLLRRARIRIEIAGDEDDVEEAIDILAEALDVDPDNPETQELLQQAAEKSPHLNLKVRGLLERYGLEMQDAPPERPVERPSERPARSETAPRRSSPRPASENGHADSAAAMPDIAQAYYSGDYQRAIDLANQVLAEDPDNTQAQDYRQKAEDNLLRGVVPDHRIPFDARVSYNRANSLVRAGNYDEAERLYREARDLAARAGITSWKDVEQALLDIQDLALARELLTEGDRLLAADDWDAALQKYEGATRVVPNDPMAQERIELVRRVRKQFDQATVQFNTVTGTLTERARNLQLLLNTLAGLRQMLPSSERLKRLVREIEERSDSLISQLYNQAQGALTRTDSATVLEERLRLTSEAVRALETAADLNPGDSDINALLQRARQSEADMSEARHIIERASALIAQNYENELSQARTMLSGLRDYAQDPRYRMVVSDLLTRHLERVEAALDQNDPQTAQRWLDAAKEEPFNILGRRTEIFRVEERVRSLRRRRYTVLGISGIIILLILGAAAFATKPVWNPILNPPTDTPTLTPSITPMPTWTSTPSYTPTETLTPTWTPTPSFTPTHTWTPTPSSTPTDTLTPSITPTASDTPTQTSTPTDTPTPTLTPTPTILCRVFVGATAGYANIRTQPNPNATLVFQAGQGQRMDVLEQRIGTADNQLWFRVRISIEDLQVNGWVRADRVDQIDDCPAF